ncbi:Crp/Fnr family transcriptional regulator [soil metagenome]
MTFTASTHANGLGAPAVVGSRVQAPRTGNRLLNALAPADFAQLRPHLERGQVDIYHMLAQQGGSFEHVHFPESCVISLVSRMANGSGVEAGTIGNEGMAGLPAYLGGESSESDTFCQVAGVSLRVPVQVILDAAAERPEIRRLFNRYVVAYLSLVSQSVACNRLHDIEQRCARWLLMTHDRVGDVESFPLKHEFLALMLGVRRAGVTTAAGVLQERGLIRYRRGIIRVVDRTGLEAAACECYGMVRARFDRLLPA